MEKSVQLHYCSDIMGNGQLQYKLPRPFFWQTTVMVDTVSVTSVMWSLHQLCAHASLRVCVIWTEQSVNHVKVCVAFNQQMWAVCLPSLFVSPSFFTICPSVGASWFWFISFAPQINQSSPLSLRMCPLPYLCLTRKYFIGPMKMR